MNRKFNLIISILLLTLVAFVGYRAFLSPQGVEGEKEVTINIINEREDVDETFTYNTDNEFLLSLLEENQEELGITFQEYDFGVMITGMMDYEADSDIEYFHTYINDEDAMTGPGEIPLNDQDKYTFELTNY